MFKITIKRGIKSYTISERKNHKSEPAIWFENEIGEGMEVNESQFFDMLDEIFRGNF